jgi:hypothetical protein
MSREGEKPWWRIHEEVAALFERLIQPIEAAVQHDVRHRDVVGVLRQLDVGVIDESYGERRVHAFVEVQKRSEKVGMKDFGNWIYKLETLPAKELIIVSEVGFSASVLRHVRQRYAKTVRLGVLHETETGFIERINSTCLGLDRVLDQWWFASIFVQFADADEIARVEMSGLNTEENIFSQISPMGLIRFAESVNGDIPAGRMQSLIIEADEHLRYLGRPIRRILITAEKQRLIWEPQTKFYAYEEIHPQNEQRGIAIISNFKVDASRTGTLTLVISPDPANIAGNNARIAGQLEFTS